MFPQPHTASKLILHGELKVHLERVCFANACLYMFLEPGT